MLERSKLIVVNAPPNSGKDYTCELLASRFNALHVEIKSALFDAAIAASGVSRSEWFERYNNRSMKEHPWFKLQINGDPVSPRQWLIHVSENVMKPMFGKQVFGMIAANKMQDDDTVYAFSDGGFNEEVIPLIERVGKQNSLLIQISCKGESFEKYNDSRNYIDPFPFGSSIFIENCKTEKYDEMLIQHIKGINFLK